MKTKKNHLNILEEFCIELKKTTNCTDSEVGQFVDFFEEDHLFVPGIESLETSF